MPAPEAGAPGPVRRLGVFGGTFDPPHLGHVAVARRCVEALGLDRLLLVVANDPWLKAPTRRITPAEDRLVLVEAAVAGLPGVEASRLEIDRGGPSYTVETVEQLLAGAGDPPGQPPPEVVVVVGADLVTQVDGWERAADLRRLVTLAVVLRPGSPAPVPSAGWRWVAVEGVAVPVSSSEVRRRLEEGEPVDAMVPPAVMREIGLRGLYARSR